MSLPAPVTLGLRKSFGFGDRLGLAGPGHLAALRAQGRGFSGIFAQQSIREMTRTQRTPQEVMGAAQRALAAGKFSDPWGADADHLKTTEDIDKTAAAGFTFFTLDPSPFVNNEADKLDEAALAAQVAALLKDGVFPAGWDSQYLKGAYDGGSTGGTLKFERTGLHRAAVKYGRAIAQVALLSDHLTKTLKRPYEIEVSVDETDTPTKPLEHLFWALELKRRGVQHVVSLAPRFIGDFEKGIDYKGDLKEFEKQLRVHAAIAEKFGPYKISVHSGSDKFSIYPIVGRVCRDRLHLKTAGTSYLEALRAVGRVDPTLFGQIAAYAAGRFTQDKASYHISANEAGIAAIARTAPADYERVYLNETTGRQLLHVTFGSVLTLGQTPAGRPFKDAILEILAQHADLHAEILVKHLGEHLRLLNAG
jgi:tagaturonate epimerase